MRLRVYPPGKHFLCPTLSHIKTQKLGLRKQTLSKTSRTARNLYPSGYGIFAHQHDQSFFCTPSFLALTTERVGTRLRVYPPGRHSLGLTLSHVKTQKQGLRKQTLSKTGRIARNLRLSGYGIFAHQRDQNLFTRTPSFTALTMERVEAHQPFYTKGGDGLKIVWP